MAIAYRQDAPISGEQFADLLLRSGLSERRPVDDAACLAGMVANSNLMLTAWVDDLLVGVARSMTDFHYACYLSDLAVDRACQHQGIGRELIRRTQSALGPKCKLILVAAPDADGYYDRLGMTRNPRCWVLDRNQSVRD